jgi:hypothetical protein
MGLSERQLALGKRLALLVENPKAREALSVAVENWCDGDGPYPPPVEKGEPCRDHKWRPLRPFPVDRWTYKAGLKTEREPNTATENLVLLAAALGAFAPSCEPIKNAVFGFGDGRGPARWFMLVQAVERIDDADDLGRINEILAGVQEAYPADDSVRGDLAPILAPEEPESPVFKAVHSPDFTFVNWFGTEYTFALGVQSQVVAILWEEWERSGLGLHQQTVRVKVDANRDTFRMATAFRNNPALGTMIQKTGDGRYRLDPQGNRKSRPHRGKK